MLQHPLIDLVIILILLTLLLLVVLRVRNRMLRLWQEVSRLELEFHHRLFDTVKLFLDHKEDLIHHDHGNHYKTLEQYKEGTYRSLSLNERQAIHDALQNLHLCVDRTAHPTQVLLDKQFKDLQNIRRKYNSKVLHYNDFINSFPMRILSKRMHFKEKEYFG